MKKGKKTVNLIVVLLILALASVLFISGLPLSKFFGVYDIRPTSELISYGLDLTGGVYVVLEADESEGEIQSDTLDKAIATIRTRIHAMGVKEPTIAKQGENQIRISIPDIQDQQEALDMVGKTAKLEFVGPDDTVILTGANVKSSSYETYQDSYGVSSPSVKLVLDEEGTELFKAATEKYLNQVIEIRLDGEVISDPKVNTQITNGEAYITGIGDREEAINLATLIKAGALPVNFTPVQVETVGPTLGQNSLEKSIMAGIIGVVLILLFMLIYYRIPGLAADISLIAYILIFLYIMAFLKVTLTLPGIAGIILSIGMAVDSNVIIFERIKEEIGIGKSVFSSIDAGFSRAISTILDANVTTIIAGCALFFFGSGTIRGFALTLIIGVAVSLLTAVLVTKHILKLIVSIGNTTSPAFFGVKEAGTK